MPPTAAYLKAGAICKASRPDVGVNFLEKAFSSMRLSKSEAKKFENTCLERLLFDGSSLIQLSRWMPYMKPDMVKQSSGHANATVLVQGVTAEELCPISDEKLEELANECKSTKLHTSLDHATLTKVAEKYEYLTGKWMLFVDGSEVTRIWRRLCIDALKGRLPAGVLAVVLAPVLLPGNPNQHERDKALRKRKMNLKVANVKNKEIRGEIERYLKELGYRGYAKLKSDVATQLDVFSDMPHNKRKPSMDEIFVK